MVILRFGDEEVAQAGGAQPAIHGADMDGALVQYITKVSTAPTANDDSAAGYFVGNIWIKLDTNQRWQLDDATNGAAVWSSMGGAAAGVGTQGSVKLNANAFSSGNNAYTNVTPWVDNEANTALFTHDGTTITIVEAGEYTVLLNATHYNATLNSQSSVVRLLQPSKQLSAAFATFPTTAGAYANMAQSASLTFAAGDTFTVQTFNNLNANGGLYVISGAVLSIERIS